MDLAIILTYRCNSKCSMCYIWQNPSIPDEEISLSTLEKLPAGFDYLNLTGGEPTLRRDLLDIVDILYPKAMTLEISSNGLRPHKIEPIIKKYPDVKIRFSLEGFGATNNLIRGENNGFEIKVNGLQRLQELGGKDLGFAITIQDDNASELVKLFQFAHKQGFELSTSVLHNGFQFHKNDNFPYDPISIAGEIESLMVEQLRTNNVKNWFRAYLNSGLISKVLGNQRLMKCTALTDFVFIDPWSDVFACNVRPDLKVGNLVKQSWDEILGSSRARQVKDQVANCQQNCWMVGSAKTAMRNSRYPKIPKVTPLAWVIENKIKTILGREINLNNLVDYPEAEKYSKHHIRQYYLDQSVKRRLQRKTDVHYDYFGEFVNK